MKDVADCIHINEKYEDVAALLSVKSAVQQSNTMFNLGGS
jgi:hypothetical protein